MDDVLDVAIVGAGAAGLFAALACVGAIDENGEALAVLNPSPRVALFDGSRRLGVKILISGGGRCNLTNRDVSIDDYQSQTPKSAKSVLLAFPSSRTIRYFESQGCPIMEEPLGKVFPKSQKARDVLGVLSNALDRASVPIHLGSKVVDIERDDEGLFTLQLESGRVRARRVIVATGGKSVPKTGSQGFGFDLARRLGHTVIDELPALTPLLTGSDSPLAGHAGTTVPVSLTLVEKETPIESVSGAKYRPRERAAGSFLITHKGASGPSALDISGRCARSLHGGEGGRVLADFWSLREPDSPWAPFHSHDKLPGASLPRPSQRRPIRFETFEENLRSDCASRNQSWFQAICQKLPRRLVESLIQSRGVDRAKPLEQFSRDAWGAVYEAIVHCDIKIAGVDGYRVAEVTSGGVSLRELYRQTLESRLCPGLFFCGEVVDATGRLGGFNFQWAWASGFVAGRGAAAP